MLGLFDSGLGGLTVLRRVRALLPRHDILYFADQANLPYGDKTPDELERLIERNLSALERLGADAVIIACNTSCAIAAERGWPRLHAPILDLIESAAIAAERVNDERIGVVATSATAKSGAYGRAIRARVPRAQVLEIAAPALVPLVEAGLGESAQARSAVQAVCEPLAGSVDAVMLGCTHYPLLETHFRAALGESVRIIDPALVQAERTAELAERLQLPAGTGRLQCVTTGDLARFREALHALAPDLSAETRRLQAA